MAILELLQISPNDFPYSKSSNEKSSKRHTRPIQQAYLRRSERLAKQRRAKTQLVSIMNSSSSGADFLSSKRTVPRPLKPPEAAGTREASHPRPGLKSEPTVYEQPSFLEAMTKNQIFRALPYYYYFPQDLPYRESGAIGRANGPTPDVLVKFDEGIFPRKTRLRPVTDDDLESVEPFTISGRHGEPRAGG